MRIKTDQGSGSGVIFQTEPQGSALVLTNYHVIEGAGNVDVVAGDSLSYPGALRGFDAYRDLAVLAICCGRFQAMSFGDIGTLKAGSEVVAMGYPLELSGAATVTRGIVSAIRYDTDYRSWVVQTDAPINPGSSGGPLFSRAGRVVGINTYKVEYTESGRPTEGLGFAVSEWTVQAILPELLLGSMIGFPTPTPIPEPTWRTYTNLQYQYQIRVPVDWDVDDSDGSEVYFESPDGFTGGYIFSFELEQGEEFISVGDWLDDIIEAESGEAKTSFELLERDIGTISSNGGKGHVRYRIQYGQEYCVQNVATVLWIRGYRAFEVAGWVCEHSAEEYQDIINEILISFAHQ